MRLSLVNAIIISFIFALSSCSQPGLPAGDDTGDEGEMPSAGAVTVRFADSEGSNVNLAVMSGKSGEMIEGFLDESSSLFEQTDTSSNSYFVGWAYRDSIGNLKFITGTYPDTNVTVFPLFEKSIIQVQAELDENGNANISYMSINGQSGQTVEIPQYWRGCPVVSIKSIMSLGTSVSFPSTLKSIGDDCFSKSAGAISELILNDGLEQIGSNAFSNLTSLVEIEIPSSVSYVGSNAFSGCTELRNIYTSSPYVDSWDSKWKDGCDAVVQGSDTVSIVFTDTDGQVKKTLTGMSGDALPEAEMDDIPVMDGHDFMGWFTADGQILGSVFPAADMTVSPRWFVNDGRLVYEEYDQYVRVMPEEGASFNGKLVLPSYYHGLPVTYVEGFTDMSGLTEVVLPDQLECILPSAFRGCTSLNMPDFPETLRSVLDEAFKGCTSMTGPLKLPQSLTTISASAFSDTGINSVSLPSSVESVGTSAFAGCENLVTVTISGDCELNSGVFLGCTALKTFNVADGVRLIANIISNHSVFSGCTSLQSVDFISHLEAIGDEYFKGCTGLSGHITVPSTVSSVGAEAFSGCEKITSVTIESGVQKIGHLAFSGCKNIEKLTIGAEEITGFNSSLFGADYDDTSFKLKEVIFLEGVESIGDSTFSNLSNLTTIILPPTLKSIGGYAFSNCGLTGTLVIPASTEYVGEYAFSYNESLESIYCEGEYKGQWGEEWSGDAAVSWNVDAGKEVTLVFSGYPEWNVTDMPGIGIALPTPSEDGMIFVGWYTVEDSHDSAEPYSPVMPQQDTVLYPCFIRDDGLSFTEKKDGTYEVRGSEAGVSAEVYIPAHYRGKDVTALSEAAFRDETGLKKVKLPESLTEIGSAAFYGCTSLSSVNIPSRVTAIPQWCFWNCTSLVAIEFPDGLELINSYSFQSCKSLTSITVPISVEKIWQSAFSFCENLRTVTVSGGPDIGSEAFYSCTALERYTMEGQGSMIYRDAFSSCSSLEYFSGGNNTEFKEESIFTNCPELKYVVIGADSIWQTAGRQFINTKNVKIFCEGENNLSSWAADWTTNTYTKDIPLYWKGEWSMVDGCPVPGNP